MKTSDILKPMYISKVIGGLFLVLSAYLFFMTSYFNAALGSFFIGIVTVVILHLPTVEEETSIASLECDVVPLENILKDLELSGNGISVKPSEDLSESRIFVPSDEMDGVPDLYDEITLVSDGLGISIPPPGLPLLKKAKERMEYDYLAEGIEGARECMGILTHGLDLAGSFSFREEDGRYKLRITHKRYWDYCKELREENGEICTRTACPLCSSYITCASEGLDKSLKISDFKVEDKHVIYTLEEVG